MIRRAPGGYSLVIVLMTLGLLTVSMLSLWAFIEASALSTGEILKKRKSFYTCDGMTRVVGHLVGDYVRQLTAPPTTMDAQAYLDARLPALIPAGYTMAAPDGLFTVTDIEMRGDLAIPNGPYEGIVGRETSLKFTLRLKETSPSSDFACQIEKELALSQIGLFQFGLFSGLDKIQLSQRSKTGVGGPAEMRISGRVHANGDVCTGDLTGAAVGTQIERLTTAGHIYDQPGPCALGGTRNRDLKVGDIGGPITDLGMSSNIGMWPNHAETTLGGRVRNVNFGVQPLELLASTNAQAAQMADGTTAPQGGSLRFLVDPPVPGETDGEKRTKLAYVADLRIIDGVWYKRDGANPDNWPGIPIWSDHPGDAHEHVDAGFMDRGVSYGPGVAVGQAQLAATGALGWAGTVPRRYSYYAFDPATSSYYAGQGADLPDASSAPVISYGGLKLDPRVLPAVRRFIPAVVAQATASPLPTPAQFKYCAPALCPGWPLCNSDFAMPATSAFDGYCAGTTRSSTLAAATSSSFADTHRQAEFPAWLLPFVTPPSGAQSGDRILTTNFDVEAFQRALADTTPGELGWHFRTTPFNGIVWISSLWPGGWGGLADGSAPSLTDALDQNTMREPAFPLCSESLSAALDAATPTVAVPDCVALMNDPGRVRSWPNAVRIINAAQINTGAALGAAAGALPTGLTIASNLPVYVLGDVNTTSIPAPTSAAAAAAAPWVPVLVAGDTVTLLSSAFRDARFFRLSFDPSSADAATATTYNMAILTGMPKTPAPATRLVDMKAAVRLLENWAGVTQRVNGSIVVGYNPVYSGVWDDGETNNAEDRVNTTLPASTDYFFDYRMQRLEGQPLGGIHFNVQSVRQWERY